MVKFQSSKDQVVDILTKPLVPYWFNQLKLNLNMWSPTLRLRGHVKTIEDIALNVKQ